MSDVGEQGQGMRMSNGKVLTVDDEAIARRLLSEFLEDAGYEVAMASDGEQAMAVLEAEYDRFDAVVLDRVMPRMDGMQVMRAIAADTRFIGLPVIMQTALAEPDEIRAGIEAGAYYYITKPYDEDTLVRVVGAAIEKFRQFREVMSWGIEATAGLSLLRRGEFQVRTHQEANMVANLLADLAARPAPVINGLMELITNAIENGNLDVDAADKADFVVLGQWGDEVRRRLALPENREKSVSVRFVVSGGRVDVAIKDQGAGFDWRPFMELDESRAYDIHGRGIAMAAAFSFDTIEYGEEGTLVEVTFPAAR